MPLPRFVSIRRTHSGTPLARHFDRPGGPIEGSRSKGRPSSKGTIPWESFDRSLYTKEALALASNAQRALALGEYGAVHLFSRLASAVALNAAPLDIVRAAAAIPAD